MARSNQAGSHQLARPNKCMSEGTRTVRTIKASMRMAAGQADAELLDNDLVAQGERGEDQDHDRCRGGNDASGGGLAQRHRRVVVPLVAPILRASG